MLSWPPVGISENGRPCPLYRHSLDQLAGEDGVSARSVPAVFAPTPGNRSIRSAIAASWGSVVMFSLCNTFQALSGSRGGDLEWVPRSLHKAPYASALLSGLTTVHVRFEAGEDDPDMRGNPCGLRVLDQERDVDRRVRERAIRLHALRTIGASAEPSVADAREAQVSDQSPMGLYGAHYQCNSIKGLFCPFPSLDTVANRKGPRRYLSPHSALSASRP
jgi:hypothetical protein